MSKQLWKAIRFKNIDTLKLLLDLGEDINSKNGHETLLEFAIRCRWFDIAELLIERGADVNLNCPIHLSVSSKSLALTQKLIDYGADIQEHHKQENQFPLLYLAICAEQPEMVKLLINSGAPINEVVYLGKTAVELAATYGNSQLVKWLLDQGATKSLHIAVAVGDLQQVKQYLEAGGDPDAPLGGGYGCPPIYIAAAHNQLEVAELLIQAGANLDLECEQDDFAILAACCSGSPEMVKLLVESGARIDVDNNGGDAICNAAWHGRLDIVRFLVEECNRPVEEMNYHEKPFEPSPVANAAKQGHLSIIEFLVSKGASIPEHSVVWAAEQGHNEIIQWLAEHNCDLNFPLFGRTALYEAIRTKRTTTVETLLRLGAKFDLGLEIGERTELYYAASHGDLEIVKLLVQAGAEVNAWLGYIETPLERAGECRADDVVEFLIQHGAKG